MKSCGKSLAISIPSGTLQDFCAVKAHRSDAKESTSYIKWKLLPFPLVIILHFLSIVLCFFYFFVNFLLRYQSPPFSVFSMPR